MAVNLNIPTAAREFASITDHDEEAQRIAVELKQQEPHLFATAR